MRRRRLLARRALALSDRTRARLRRRRVGPRGAARLVTTGADKCVRVWSVPDLRQTACFHAAGSFGSSDGIGGEGAFAPTDDALAVGDGSGRLHVLRVHAAAAAS